MTVTWDRLYQDRRHQLRYPSEHVVRFLASQPPGLAIDIGCGWGRHMQVMRELGFEAFGTDASLQAALNVPGAVHAPMTDLPYPDDTFDVAVSWGVFYYGTPAEHDRAIAEMHRVLRPGGSALVCVRTDRDWRRTGIPDWEVESGLTMHYTREDDIEPLYAAFSVVSWERCEWTTHSMARRNSDWLITVTK